MSLSRFIVSKVDRFSLGGSYDFLTQNSALGTVQGYMSRKIVPVRPEEGNDGPMVPESAPAVVIH